MVRQAALITAAAAAFWGLCGAASASSPRRIAVVVGANVGAPSQVHLRHAARDARKMAQVLTELGSVAPRDLRLLDGTPTAVDVLSALADAERLARETVEAGGEAAILFYYSGHASKGALHLYETSLPLKDLREQLKQSRATVRLAVLDACHSGASIRRKGGKRSRKKVRFAIDQSIGTEGYAILTSSAANEESQESDELRGSFFTHHLVSGLRGAADEDRDHSVTLSEAYRYAYARTLRQTASKARVAQHPNFDMSLKGGRDVVLTSVPEGAARVRLAGEERGAHWIVYEPRSGLVVAELQEQPGHEVTVAVPAGNLEIYRRTSDRVARGEIAVAAGREVELSPSVVGLEEVSLSAYLRKGEPLGLVLSALIGVQTFGEEAVRSRYVGPMPLVSIGLRYENVGVTGLDVAMDLGFMSIGQQQRDGDHLYRQQLTQFQLGAGLMYRYDLDNLSLSVGPRIAYMLLHRSPDEEVSEAETLHTVAVGGTVGAYWRFSPRISVGITGRVSYVPMNLRDVERDQWVVEAQAAGAYHF